MVKNFILLVIFWMITCLTINVLCYLGNTSWWQLLWIPYFIIFIPLNILIWKEYYKYECITSMIKKRLEEE